MYETNIHLSGVSAPSFLENVNSHLVRLKAKDIESADGKTIKFRGGVLRAVLNTNMLVPISKGLISLDESNDIVKIKLWFTETIIFGVVATLLLVLGYFNSNMPLQLLVVGIILIWFFFVGLNVAISIFRFNGLVRKCGVKT